VHNIAVTVITFSYVSDSGHHLSPCFRPERCRPAV
jgi:hypothetical protein